MFYRTSHSPRYTNLLCMLLCLLYIHIFVVFEFARFVYVLHTSALMCVCVCVCLSVSQ